MKQITLRDTIHSCLHCSVLYSQTTLSEFVLIISITVLCTSTVHFEFLSKARKHNQENVYLLLHSLKLNGEAKPVKYHLFSQWCIYRSFTRLPLTNFQYYSTSLHELCSAYFTSILNWLIVLQSAFYLPSVIWNTFMRHLGIWQHRYKFQPGFCSKIPRSIS